MYFRPDIPPHHASKNPASNNGIILTTYINHSTRIKQCCTSFCKTSMRLTILIKKAKISSTEFKQKIFSYLNHKESYLMN